ncbi:acyl-[acyl-carrier-protein] thioesterase [Myroides guanonis]|uniref:Acyl-ACP thioesterase n=1 Tax=Myroides guanonis TaxID=1150112 RepID=A0A1I3KNJ5_9FLAO|nr:acyl-ACP thioesterase domain-containing protein [Myroides guanonis]SFI73930.1 Acyl-ACP thioesterase [Myroides guanonis]
MPISSLFTSIYEEVHEVDFSECAASGALSLDGLCKIAQKVATKHSILGGISFHDLQKIKQAWVLNKMRLEIDHLPKWQDIIHIKTWIESLDGIRSIRNFEIILNNRRIIGISTLWVIINTDRRRPESMLLPHSHFEKFNGITAIQQSFKNIPTQVEYKLLKNGIVEYSDLDMVQHVNNAKYIEWIINAVHSNSLDFPTVREIDMIFQKEMLWETKYEIYINQDNDNYNFKISSSEGIHFLCRVN